jgi:hypothetical protein
MKCDLHRHFGELAGKLRVGERHTFAFSAESFRAIPELLESDQLVITKSHHDYDGSRVDRLNFCADKATYQNLGLLVLSVVFRPGGSRIRLILTNPSGIVKNLVVEYSGLTRRVSEHLTRPERFLFHPQKIDTHPWAGQSVSDLLGLPRFTLTNLKEFVVTEEDRADRNTVKGFGNDDASVRLAGLLLNIGSAENETSEVVLEGEGGFRGVGLHSAEASFYLPDRWAETHQQ